MEITVPDLENRPLKNKRECQCLCVQVLQDSTGFSSPPGSEMSANPDACANPELLSHISGFLCGIASWYMQADQQYTIKLKEHLALHMD